MELFALETTEPEFSVDADVSAVEFEPPLDPLCILVFVWYVNKPDPDRVRPVEVVEASDGTVPVLVMATFEAVVGAGTTTLDEVSEEMGDSMFWSVDGWSFEWLKRPLKCADFFEATALSSWCESASFFLPKSFRPLSEKALK